MRMKTKIWEFSSKWQRRHHIWTATYPVKPGLACCPLIFLTRVFVGSFMFWMPFTGTNQQKYTGLHLFCIYYESWRGRDNHLHLLFTAIGSKKQWSNANLVIVEHVHLWNTSDLSVLAVYHPVIQRMTFINNFI